MTRSNALLGRSVLLALGVAALSAPAFAQSAADIHRGAVVVDAHVDVPASTTLQSGATIDAGTQIDVAKLRAGQVDVIFPSVFVEQSVRTQEGYAAARGEADAKLAAIIAIAERHPDAVALATSADAIEAAVRQNKTAIVPSFLNAYAFGTDPEALKSFYDRGVRVVGLVHAGNNDFVDSSRPHSRDKPNEHGGLSPAGKRVVQLANDLGVLIDVSQLTVDGLKQTIELSRAPVIASHSGVSGVVKSPRNLNDEELDLIKANGGVVGVVAFSSYLRHQTPEQQEAVRAVRAKYGAVNGYEGLTPDQRAALGRETAALQTRANVDDFVTSIDYAVKRIGIDHVAISSDFNHGGGVTGFEHAGEAANVTAALVKAGYKQADIEKLWGGNVLRILRAAEAAANKDYAGN